MKRKGSRLCRRCPAACLRTEEARPSMEACGIDVFATASANGMPIEVLKTRRSHGNCYALILLK
jgi:predicted metal-binding protein